MKKKWTEILLWGGLALLVLFVIVTAMILHAKNQKLEDIKAKNELVTPNEEAKEQENKIFLKNFEILIDNDMIF